MKTNPEHDKLPEQYRQIASVIFVTADNKVLMGRKDPTAGGSYPDLWHIPGGGLEQKPDGTTESLEEAAVREALEETGLDIHKLQSQGAIKSFDQLEEPGSGQSIKTDKQTDERFLCIMEFNRFVVHFNLTAEEIPLTPTKEFPVIGWYSPEQLENMKQVEGGVELFRELGLMKRAV